MGIKNLNTFLKDNAAAGIQEIEFSELKGQTIAIDTSIFLYKFMYSMRFIDNFMSQVAHFRSHDIIPLYVFDGAPPKEKQEVLNQRKEQKEKIYSKLDELNKQIKEKKEAGEECKNLQKDYQSLKRKCINISRDDIINLKNVFDILGVAYIQADSEADLVCCELYKRGQVDACMSNDMDFLPSGCGKLVRNYNLSNLVTVYDLDFILSTLEIDYDQFVDFCILCGCDYSPKIARLGAITAYNYIKNHNRIETILDKFCGENKKFKIPENFDYLRSRVLLKNENQGQKIMWKVKNMKSKVKKEDINPTQLLYIKSMTRFKDAKFDSTVDKICQV